MKFFLLLLFLSIKSQAELFYWTISVTENGKNKIYKNHEFKGAPIKISGKNYACLIGSSNIHKQDNLVPKSVTEAVPVICTTINGKIGTSVIAQCLKSEDKERNGPPESTFTTFYFEKNTIQISTLCSSIKLD
jgi:hypothetical protein